MPCERKPDLDRACTRCGAPIVRKRFPSGLLETYGRYVTRQTCGRGKCHAPAAEAVIRDLEARLRLAQEEETKLRIADLKHTIEHHRRLRARTETMLAQERHTTTVLHGKLIATGVDI